MVTRVMSTVLDIYSLLILTLSKYLPNRSRGLTVAFATGKSGSN